MKASYLLLFFLAGLAVFYSVYSAGKSNTADFSSQTELLLRKIGHQVLLSNGDDSSRVMPVKKLNPKHYQVYFENKLVISHDSLVRIVNAVFKQNLLPGDYVVNVVDCKANDTVYGFAVLNAGQDSLVACEGRTLPLGCYYLDIQFADHNNKTSRISYGILAAVVLTGLFLTVKRLDKKKDKTIPAEQSAPASKHDLIRIGKYNFNRDQHYIELAGTKTVLTNKESKLLFIFSQSLNEIIAREKLQKEVWENEGVIVTRSLDMFVSKLRKKLQDDDQVKIVNFPGKGYMLEVNN